MLFLVCAGAISDIVWLVYFPVRLHRAELWTHSVLKNLSDPLPRILKQHVSLTGFMEPVDPNTPAQRGAEESQAAGL